MATIYQIRRENLRHLIRRDSAKSIAATLGYSNASYISQLAGPTPTRELKEDTARDFERKMKLAPGWLDVERDEYGNQIVRPQGPVTATEKAPPPVRETKVLSMLDTDRLTYCLNEVTNQASGKLPSNKVMDIVTMAYEAKELEGTDLEVYIKRLIKLTA